MRKGHIMKYKALINVATALLITTALGGATFTKYANAKDANTNARGGVAGPLLGNYVAGKLMLKADLGYVYNFGGGWNKTTTATGLSIGDSTSVGASAVGYGVSLGWTHTSGFGISADYMGFKRKGIDVAASDEPTQFNYDASYNVVTFVPSYRIKLDSAGDFGVRLGLGLGLSVADVNWGNKITANGAQQSGGARVAGGAVYNVEEKARLSDFGMASDPNFGGNCNSLNGKFGGLLHVSDSAGATSTFPALSTGSNGRNRCTATGRQTNSVAGFTDAQIALAFKKGSISLTDISESNPFAYGVWSAALSGNNLPLIINNVIANVNAFEKLNLLFLQPGNAVTLPYGVWQKLSPGAQAKFVAAGAVGQTLEQATAACTASKGTWDGSLCTLPSAGSFKDEIGMVIAPQVTFEYDKGQIHADLSIKYLHGLLNVRYFGSEIPNGIDKSDHTTYTSKAGPLAFFIGAGFGANF